MSEKIKKEIQLLYEKYKPFFNDEFQFTLLSNSVMVKSGYAFYPIKFEDPDCLELVRSVIKLKCPKQKI